MGTIDDTLKWITNTFKNRTVVFCGFAILVLFGYFSNTPDINTKTTIGYFVLILVVIGLILQFWDGYTESEAQKRVLETADRTSRTLLKKYMTWGNELKEFFGCFVNQKRIWVDVSKPDIISYGIFEDSEHKHGWTSTTRSKKEESVSLIEQLKTSGVIKQKGISENKFELYLTEDGGLLLKELEKIKELLDEDYWPILSE